MGWKASLVIIEHAADEIQDQQILEAIGLSSYQPAEETSFDACLYPRDESINIGYFNGNIVICDDYQITTRSLERATDLSLSRQEQALCALFPNSEIVTAACHSVVNYHGYSLIQAGEKKRLKVISADEPRREFGTRMIEEERLYKNAYEKDGAYFWKSEWNPDDDSVENQLMEDFTFEIAKRRLGIRLDGSDEELWEVKFRKYLAPKKPLIRRKDAAQKPDDVSTRKRPSVWLIVGIAIVLLTLWLMMTERF